MGEKENNDLFKQWVDEIPAELYEEIQKESQLNISTWLRLELDFAALKTFRERMKTDPLAKELYKRTIASIRKTGHPLALKMLRDMGID